MLAAGPGRRLGQAVPKALSLLDGLPLLSRAASALRDSGVVDQLVIVGPAGAAPDVQAALASALPPGAALVVDGAGTRHGSLHCALAVLAAEIDVVVLHDASRPLAPADLVVRVLKAVYAGADAAVPVVEVTETVKELDRDGRIARTVPRERLVRIQTPQAVRRILIDQAHAGCGPDGPDGADELAVLAPAAAKLVTVDGDVDAFPVVQATDLAFAEAVLARRRKAR
ncbi:MAG TPA: 2-C-methyl-D-erythritol 4-phosphate cytidylyltransferase [Mycobacteriales bacterium]|nr:2-C-methyl-D-erythritol 4-phosphate cytidylyltransferase [Mycobacteriales bacterium]